MGMKCCECEWAKKIKDCWEYAIPLCTQTSSPQFLSPVSPQESCTYEPSESLPTLYHVTPTANVESIMESGLMPQIGPRSQRAGEEDPAIYFFVTKVEMENALMNWLGEEMGDRPISILEVRLPRPFQAVLFREGFEVGCAQHISPEYIRIFNENYICPT